MNVHEQRYSIRPVTYDCNKTEYRHCTISIKNAFKCIKNATVQHFNDSSSLFSTSNYTILPLFMQHSYQQQRECKIENTSAISFQSAFVFNNISLHNIYFHCNSVVLLQHTHKLYLYRKPNRKKLQAGLVLCNCASTWLKIYNTFQTHKIIFGKMWFGIHDTWPHSSSVWV